MRPLSALLEVVLDPLGLAEQERDVLIGGLDKPLHDDERLFEFLNELLVLLVAPGLTETDELVDLCDERVQAFVRSWAKRGLPLPEVGHELQDDRGRICAQAELAWPERKVAAILPEGGDAQTAFERLGWTVFDATGLPAQEAQLRTSLGV